MSRDWRHPLVSATKRLVRTARGQRRLEWAFQLASAPGIGRVLALGAITYCLLVGVGCQRQVVRLSDGLARRERSIDARAFAAYTRARIQESSGQQKAAIDSYREVLRFDSASDDALVRLGSLYCRTDPKLARQNFDRARRINEDSATLADQEARCLLEHRDLEAALESARRAMRLNPSDPRSSRLLIHVLSVMGKRAEATTLAWSHVASFPRDPTGWLLLAKLDTGSTERKEQLRARASERIPRQFAYQTPPHEDSASPSLLTRADRDVRWHALLDQALARSDTREVHRAARELRLGTTALATLAYERGAFAFAYEQATVAGRIQPTNGAIWLMRLQLADLLRRDEDFDLLLKQPPEHVVFSETESAAILDLVRRRVGFDATSSSNE